MTRLRGSRKTSRRVRKTRRGRHRRQKGGAYAPAAGIVNDSLKEWLGSVLEALKNTGWETLSFGDDAWPKITAMDEVFQPGGLPEGTVNSYLVGVQAQLTNAIKNGATFSDYIQGLDTEKKEFLAKIESTLRWQAGLPEFEWTTQPLLLWFFVNAAEGKVGKPEFSEVKLPTDGLTQPAQIVE